MRSRATPLVIAALCSFASFAVHATDIKLYPTGPAVDSAFVRFVNGTTTRLAVKAAGSGSEIELTPDSPATAYMPVAGGTTINGTLIQGKETQSVSLEIKPSEFVTVLGFVNDKGLQVREVREEADGFTAVRASVAFYDLNGSCQNASVQVAGRSAFLFENVVAGQWARREVNPVPLSVQLICGGQASGKPLDMGTLQAGERYSLFLIPGDPATGFLQIRDTVAR